MVRAPPERSQAPGRVLNYPGGMTQHSRDPLVEIVIPVHSTSRPIARAVSSALLASKGARPGQCRVTVVAHHVSADEVRAVLSAEQRAAVTVIECEDLSLIHISEPTRRLRGSRMPSSA